MPTDVPKPCSEKCSAGDATASNRDDLDRATARVHDVGTALGGRPYLPEAALRFVLGHPQIASVIAGTTSERHLRENVRALDEPQLSESDMRLIIGAFADVQLRV